MKMVMKLELVIQYTYHIGNKYSHNNDQGQPGRHRHQIQATQGGKAHPQHFPEKLPAVLGQVLFPKVPLAAFSIIEIVHHSAEHGFLPPNPVDRVLFFPLDTGGDHAYNKGRETV